jgi:hypothetical protein
MLNKFNGHLNRATCNYVHLVSVRDQPERKLMYNQELTVLLWLVGLFVLQINLPYLIRHQDMLCWLYQHKFCLPPLLFATQKILVCCKDNESLFIKVFLSRSTKVVKNSSPSYPKGTFVYFALNFSKLYNKFCRFHEKKVVYIHRNLKSWFRSWVISFTFQFFG